MATTFGALGLQPDLLEALEALGFESPTGIQEGAIPHLLAGRDVLGQAQTGTGKTAAFALPMLQGLAPNCDHVQGLVVTPTRELAKQVASAIHSYGGQRYVRVLPVYGGQAYSRQLTRLERGVEVVVGTPGRMLDLISRGALQLNAVQFVVLDEADEMLSMGFIEDIEAILAELPEGHQTALFSATLPEPIRRLSSRYMCSPELVAIDPGHLTLAAIEQRGYMVHQQDKLDALSLLLEYEDMTSAMIFCQTRVGANALADALANRNYGAEALHGDMTQEAREAVLGRFRRGRTNLLVCTDVAARGLDIDDVSHVINYDMPQDPESYVHRTGRTGRAGKQGVAITLVTPHESWRVGRIEGMIKRKLERADLPDAAAVRARRQERLLDALAEAYAEGDLADERAMMQQLAAAGHDPLELAAAAIKLVRASEAQRPIVEVSEPQRRPSTPSHAPRSSSTYRNDRPAPRRGERPSRRSGSEAGMVRLTMNMGQEHSLRAGEIVGAIANTSNIPGKAIGAIRIQSQEATVDVAQQHAEQVLTKMKGWKLRGQAVTLQLAE